MSNRVVIDTVGFINFFNAFFSEEDKLSKETRHLINKCINSDYNNYKLIVPSIVFIEIHTKFLTNEELAKKFYYNVFMPVKDSIDVEIKPIEREVLKVLSTLKSDVPLELHDMIIYSSAIQLECPLITNDSKIIKANRNPKIVDIIF